VALRPARHAPEVSGFSGCIQSVANWDRKSSASTHGECWVPDLTTIRLQAWSKVHFWQGYFPLLVSTFTALACAALLASVVFRHIYIGMDDANIAMVYAQNLADGHGFAYNVGGERVEGFTSLLYVLIAAAIFSISPFPELFLHGLGVLLAALAVFFSMVSLCPFARAAESVRFRPLHLVMIAWAVGSPAFIIWTTVSLMDVALWCFMLTCSAMVVLFEIGSRHPSPSRLAAISTLAALIPLTRPEGFVLAPILILTYALGRRLNSTTWRTVRTSLLVPGLAYLLAAAGLTAFRIAYFGFPLPNTYYAKVSPNVIHNVVDGTQYLKSFVLAQQLMVLVLSAIVIGVVRNASLVGKVIVYGQAAAEPNSKRSRIRVAQFVVSVLAIGGLLLPVYGGGDHFAGFRFYQPIWPILILPIIFLFYDVSSAMAARTVYDRRRFEWIAAIASLPILFGPVAAPWPSQPQPTLLEQFVIAEDGRRLGVVLNRLFPSAAPQVGVTAAGGVKYTYHGPVFDLLGLNHVAMGHSPGERLGYKNHAAFNKDVFWANAPAVVLPILCPRPLDNTLAAEEFEKRSDGVLQRLFRDARFQRRYLLVGVRGRAERLFDGDPFFFIPHRLPRPALAATAYRDSTLIAYVQPGIIDRLESHGWNVSLLSQQRRERRTGDRSRAAGPCTPRATGAVTTALHRR
jgi:arabinofuranosyltransferase